MGIEETINERLEVEFEQSKDEAILVLIEKRKLFRRYDMNSIEEALKRTIEESNELLLEEKQLSPFYYRSDKIQMLDISDATDKKLILSKYEAIKLPIIILYQNKEIRTILRKILF